MRNAPNFHVMARVLCSFFLTDSSERAVPMGTVWLLDQCVPQYDELLMRIAKTFTSYSLKMTN